MRNQGDDSEQQRIRELYARMAEGELEAIAADSLTLTDVARRALEDEIAGRKGLGKDVAKADADPGYDEVELADFVSIRQLRDLHEALVAKGVLDSAEIECFLVDDNIIRMDWFYSNLVGGIKLCVKEEDAEAAEDLLEQPAPEEFEVEGLGYYEQPRCPKCQSLDIAFEEFNLPVAWISAYLLAPIPLHRKTWVCYSCGQQWKELKQEDS